ncbi:glycosyltransferase family 92 protein [Dyadobacter chenhuakuii]|uniref:Glycosyltransferase family 92 protein n=1 Tax=Dyadobacter chenhuakuii TaxID=2909339 RepID=A0ABY4XJB1_9BACT|nr:glycosyltransferase family 92 protein [Dyadobacter chenhuakuii]MCF2496222.1 glycosyltransferase family 92 protein [Dyadobacter chenhuakuii]USJ30285.1 glycosyltransferase family 92 protein [Dyadobacter chenhuakuii]
MFSIKKLISKFRGADQHPQVHQYDLSLCCIVKDENNYLEEWIGYHRKIGVQHFYIYDNGSKVPIRTALAAINAPADVTVIDMPGKNKHVKAYQHCLDRFGGSSTWIGFIDIDEFIVPKTASSNLPEFLKNYENYGGLGVSWLIFGSNGHVQKPGGPQLENFTKRSEVTFPPNRHIKSIVQPRFVKSAYKSHCFHYKPGYFCVNEHYIAIDGATADVSVDKIQLNHYYCRSLEEYHEKVERGISDTKRKRKLEEFHNHDIQANVIEDTTILKVLEKLNNSVN